MYYEKQRCTITLKKYCVKCNVSGLLFFVVVIVVVFEWHKSPD